MEQEVGTIYIATNLKSRKQYVGQTTTQLKKRVASHKNDNKNLPFSNAIKKYGLDNFKWVSYSCSKEDLDWTEIFLIKELNTLAPNGYNLESGGKTNKHLHKKTKQKIREKTIGRIPWNKGIPRTEKEKKNISLGMPNQYGENNANFGNHWHQTEEQKRIMSNLLKGKPRPWISKALKGKPKSKEHKENMKLAWKKRKLNMIGDKNG